MKKPKLRRELSLLEATFYGIGIILGAGIYALIGEAVGMAGNSAWLSFVIGAVIASFTGLSYAELSTMFPKAAAEYVYVRRAFGSRFLAFLVGWLIVFTGMVSAATVALGFAGYFQGLFSFLLEGFFSREIATIITALALIAILSFINFLGIKESSKINILFTAVEVFGLILVIVLAFNLYGKVNYFETPAGLRGVFSAAALIFFAYIGFEDIANITEETKNPKKNIPKAFILAILITTLLYVFTAIATVSLADWKELGEVANPLAFAASKSFLGDNAKFLISFVALFATTNTVLIILVVTSRMMYGIAKEKSLPEELTLIHKITRTPWIAVIVVMALSMAFVLLGKIVLVASITSLVAFVTFAAVNLSLIWLRYTMPRMKRAFRVPGNIGDYPVTAFIGFLFCLFMIFQFSWNLILLGMLVVTVGALVYEIFIKKLKKFSE
jgi:APA family basic amino acid/polyamine antiporter